MLAATHQAVLICRWVAGRWSSPVAFPQRMRSQADSGGVGDDGPGDAGGSWGADGVEVVACVDDLLGEVVDRPGHAGGSRRWAGSGLRASADEVSPAAGPGWQRSVRTMAVVKSVRGAVPVFRPARFPGPLPEPAVRLSPQRALRKSQVGLAGGYAVAGQGAGMAAPR
jgi:hypothetical protein